MKVGVLALQGDFEEHMSSLHVHKVYAVEVRTTADLKQIDALILPGGESTTIAKLLKSTGLDKAIIQRVKEGMPVWGTCAGAILLAKKVVSPVELEVNLGLIDIAIERNAYGRQTESFQTLLKLPNGSQEVFFIRAPKILNGGKSVRSLSKYKDTSVMLSSGKVLVTTFHSELSSSNLVLEFFLGMISAK
jgi:5'-phosphate synthase pdxT subunit